jgi:mxaC protein
MIGLDVGFPWALLLLPVAALPLLGPSRGALPLSSLTWVPDDRLGQAVERAFRVVAAGSLALMVLALADVGLPQSQIARTGHGAEILMVMDRSRSMDNRMLPDNWRSIDPLRLSYQVFDHGPVKSQVARDALLRFVDGRAADRFGLMFFSSNPLTVMPVTQNHAAVQAAIRAGGVGRGLSDTAMGRALLAAIQEFAKRTYSGSRVLLLISDGGAQLDDMTRKQIADGLSRQKISLVFLYLRSYNGHALDTQGPEVEAIPEVALHHFFQSLSSPYRAYQAEVPEDFAKAIAEIGALQNAPLDYTETVPRIGWRRPLMLLAAAGCAALLALRLSLMGAWI